MWGGRSHNAAAKGGAAPPGKGKSNGESSRPPPGAGVGDERPLPPRVDDNSISQDVAEGEGHGVTLSPLPPPRPWKVPGGGGGGSDAQPPVRKGSAAAADGKRWHVPGDDRREDGGVGKGPQPGGVAQPGSSREWRDPRSTSRAELAPGAPYGLDNDRGGDGRGDGYTSGGDGDNGIDDARSGTSASVTRRGAGVGAEARGQDARSAAEGIAGEVKGGGKAAVAVDGSGRPANIIRIRIPPPSGQQAKATGRPSEANRFANDKDLRPGRSSGSGTSSSHPTSGGRSTTLPLSGGRTPPSSGGGDGDFGDGGDGDGGGNVGGAGGRRGGGGDAVAEGFVRDDESFGEAASVFPGKTGRKQKIPVPTRAGGRNRTL